MTDKPRSTVVAAFPDIQSADSAIKELLRAGFPKQKIGFMIRDDEDLQKLRSADAEEKAAITRTIGGGLSGGILGGIIGSIVALTIPGFGPLISAGLLAGAGGAIAGGFTGLMSTINLSQEETDWYEEEIQAGRPVVAVEANDRYSEALAIMQTNGAYEMARNSTK